jgi:hypothetical protein
VIEAVLGEIRRAPRRREEAPVGDGWGFFVVWSIVWTEQFV